jgi:ComEC/Rec2-related protein
MIEGINGFMGIGSGFYPFTAILFGTLAFLFLVRRVMAMEGKSRPGEIFRSLCFLLILAGTLIHHAGPFRDLPPGEAVSRDSLWLVEEVHPGRYDSHLHCRSTERDRLTLLVTWQGEKRPLPGQKLALFASPDDLKQKDSSWSRYLQRKGFRFHAFADERTASLTGEGDNPGTLSRARSQASRSIHSLWSGHEADLLEALFLGERFELHPVVRERFRRSGLMHLLAASGMHVGIMIALPLLLGRILGLSRPFYMLPALPAALLYCLFAGMPVSLLRATVMVILLALSRLFPGRNSGHHILFLAAIILLLMEPSELYGLGFQLTFAATFGIITWFRPLSHALRVLPMVVRAPLALSLSAQAAVLPFTLYVLGEANLASLPAGLLASPLLAPAMVTALAALLGNSLGVPAALPVEVTSVLLDIFMEIARVGSGTGLHLVFTRVPLPVLFLPLLIPLFGIKHLSRYRWAFLSLFMVPVLLYASAEPGRPERAGKMWLIPGSRGATLCLYREGTFTLRGSPPVDRAMAEKSIRSLQPGRIVLEPVLPSMGDLYRWQSLVRRLPVSRCRYHAPLEDSPALTTFMKTVSRDSVPLKVVPTTAMK